MTRSQRAWHFRIWLLLAPVILAGLAAAIRYRAPIAILPDEPAARGAAR